MPDISLVVVDPGHFHARLVQQQMYPGLSPLVRIHAPLGPDPIDYLGRIARYNGRPQAATDWRLDVHAGTDFLDRLRDEPPGAIAIFSGRNRGKAERIISALEAGLHVLADKPAIIEREDLDRLDTALALAEARQLVFADMMTRRHNTLARLLQARAAIPMSSESPSRARPTNRGSCLAASTTCARWLPDTRIHARPGISISASKARTWPIPPRTWSIGRTRRCSRERRSIACEISTSHRRAAGPPG
jgi:hypothetical protein